MLDRIVVGNFIAASQAQRYKNSSLVGLDAWLGEWSFYTPPCHRTVARV